MLQRAFESARAQGSDVHLAVVVPKTEKKARTLAKKYGATIVDDPGRGMSAAINAGLSRRSNESYYIWLGDDDAFCAGGLEALKSLMESSPGAVVAYGACEYVNDAGDVVWTSRVGRLARLMLGFGPNLIPHPAALIRLDALEEIGGYDPTLQMVMDLDVFLKLKKKGRFVSTSHPVSQFGWHEDSLTVADRKKSSNEARMVKRRHLPPVLRLIEPLWEFPVQWASHLAARSLSRPKAGS